ncbi:hypothetical protein GGQ94_003260 [Petrimonas sulfuriphila]|jgi:hypothetical protein
MNRFKQRGIILQNKIPSKKSDVSTQHFYSKELSLKANDIASDWHITID